MLKTSSYSFTFSSSSCFLAILLDPVSDASWPFLLAPALHLWCH